MLASLPMKNEIQNMKIIVNSVIENALSNGILRELIEYLGQHPQLTKGTKQAPTTLKVSLS
jgi:hypothetical protein